MNAQVDISPLTLSNNLHKRQQNDPLSPTLLAVLSRQPSNYQIFQRTYLIFWWTLMIMSVEYRFLMSFPFLECHLSM